MVKLSFKIFGCLTVFLFMGAVGVYLAATAVVPAPRVSQKVRTVVYPLAIESAKVKFQKTMRNMNSGYPRQTLVFTELEANAYLDQYVNNTSSSGKYKNFPIKNPYIYFYDDSMRVRFDLALLESFWMLTNQWRGMKYEDNLKDLDNRKSGSTRISFTLDFELFWINDHPEVKVKKAYIGVLPLPFKGLFNSALDPINDWFAKDFGHSSKLDNFAVRRMKFVDKEFAVDMEIFVDEEYQKGLRQRQVAQAMSKNAAPFSSYLGRTSGPCSFACTEDEQEDVIRAVEQFNKETQIDEKALNEARRMRKEYTHTPENK